MSTIIHRSCNRLRALFDQATREREATIKRLDRALEQKNHELSTLRKDFASEKDATAQVNGELLRVRAKAQRGQESAAVACAALRHELEKVRRELEVAQAENRRLWEVYERDHARVLKERALFDRQRADAETATVLTRQEE
ncbi:MAG TPA: hypothetical protein VJ783_17120 [Pirellulales bacterium]|nr:hypothetical protein [Pirellulales bacterium]